MTKQNKIIRTLHIDESGKQYRTNLTRIGHMDTGYLQDKETNEVIVLKGYDLMVCMVKGLNPKNNELIAKERCKRSDEQWLKTYCEWKKLEKQNMYNKLNFKENEQKTNMDSNTTISSSYNSSSNHKSNYTKLHSVNKRKQKQLEQSTND